MTFTWCAPLACPICLWYGRGSSVNVEYLVLLQYCSEWEATFILQYTDGRGQYQMEYIVIKRNTVLQDQWTHHGSYSQILMVFRNVRQQDRCMHSVNWNSITPTNKMKSNWIYSSLETYKHILFILWIELPNKCEEFLAHIWNIIFRTKFHMLTRIVQY